MSFDLSDELRRILTGALQVAPAHKLPGLLMAMMEAGIVEDRRGETRPKLLAAPRVRAKAPTKDTQRATLKCPAKGCRNAFVTRWGGWCADHRNTAGFKKWQAEHISKAKAPKKK